MHITKSHSAIVIDNLRKDPLQTYKAIFGEDNFKGNSGSQLDFKNALTVSLKGTYAGIWKCWTDGKYGGPIKAIMRVNPQISYAKAVELGAQIAGLSNKDLNSIRWKDDASRTSYEATWTVKESRGSIDNLNKAEEQRTLVAKEIWSKCLDLEGTLGEVYLLHISFATNVLCSSAFFKLSIDPLDSLTVQVAS
jgi:hypothetical protein